MYGEILVNTSGNPTAQDLLQETRPTNFPSTTKGPPVSPYKKIKNNLIKCPKKY